MYYFGYCTFLNEREQKQYLPNGVAITKGYAANHKVEFRGTTERPSGEKIVNVKMNKIGPRKSPTNCAGL